MWLTLDVQSHKVDWLTDETRNQNLSSSIAVFHQLQQWTSCISFKYLSGTRGMHGNLIFYTFGYAVSKCIILISFASIIDGIISPLTLSSPCPWTPPYPLLWSTWFHQFLMFPSNISSSFDFFLSSHRYAYVLKIILMKNHYLNILWKCLYLSCNFSHKYLAGNTRSDKWCSLSHFTKIILLNILPS